MFEENKEDFRKWLIEDKKLSSRVAGDVLSRCKRLNKTILEDIDLSISSPESYLASLKEIKDYSKRGKQSAKTQYALDATLIAAMKKYCEYKNPHTFQNYPNGYSIRGYKRSS